MKRNKLIKNYIENASRKIKIILYINLLILYFILITFKFDSLALILLYFFIFLSLYDLGKFVYNDKLVTIMKLKFRIILFSFIGAFSISFLVQFYENIVRADYWKNDVLVELKDYKEFQQSSINNENQKNLDDIFSIIRKQDLNLTCHEKFLSKDMIYEWLDITVNSFRILEWESIDDNCYKDYNKALLDISYMLIIFGWSFTIILVMNKKINLLIKRKNHTVIIGLNKHSRQLIQDLHNNNNKCLVKTYCDDSNNKYIEELENLGKIVVVGELEYNFTDEIIHSKEIFIMNDTDSESMNNLAFIIEKIQNIKHFKKVSNKDEKAKKINIFIEIKNRENKVFFDKKGIYELSNNFYDITVFNFNELLSQRMFINRPLVSNLRRDGKNYSGNLKILIIGFNELTEEILYNILKLAHFDLKKYVEIKIIDDDSENLKLKYQKLIQKGLKPLNNSNEIFWKLEFFPISKIYEDKIFMSDDKFLFNRIILSKQKFSNSMDILNYLNNNFNFHINKKDTIVQVYNEHININTKIDSDVSTYKNFFTFGDLETLVTYENIVNNRLYDISKITNDYKENKEDKKWKNVDYFTRESNITEKLHMNVKLDIFNLVICENEEFDKDIKDINTILKRYYENNKDILRINLNEAIKLPYALDNLSKLVEFYMINNSSNYKKLFKEKKLLNKNLKLTEEDEKKIEEINDKLNEEFKACREKIHEINFYEEVKTKLEFDETNKNEENIVIMMAISLVEFYLKIKDHPNYIKLIDNLAEIEHRRWNSFHLLNGWKYGPKKDYYKKEHPNICDWETLNVNHKNVVKYDYKNIYQIPFVVHCLDEKILKIKEINLQKDSIGK